jgi:hypothetical protein
MSAPRNTSRANGEPERFSVGSALPPMLARELANRRAREELERYADDGWDDLSRPRHARHARPDPYGEQSRSVGAGAVAAAGIGFVICAVLAAVAVLWPRDDGRGGSIEASGVTTTEAPFDDVADRALDDASTAPAPATTPTSEGAATTGSTQGEGDGSGGDGPGGGSGGSGGEQPAPETTSPPQTAPPSTEPAPAPTQPPTTPQPQPQQPPAVRPGDPDVASTWDQLAQCESNGNWSADPGNGRYGGLMIDDDTWDRYGGDGRPHRHSRETQIEIARRIQDRWGWDYWDDCARRLGFDD